MDSEGRSATSEGSLGTLGTPLPPDDKRGMAPRPTQRALSRDRPLCKHWPAQGSGRHAEMQPLR
ncbi:hypothetical protein E2C01_099165 [Portunus trituberculatus]|uniref:Uncharacterized protein n=1 Tax=Portunus trituberculatus TaxID=210409 RepID=A0A5B7KA49_PORTR|nr:hypothetical protein [Portunus trituberculatus]